MINCSVEVVKKPIVKRFIPSFLDMINGSFGEFVNRLHLSSLDAAKAKRFRFCNHFTNNMYFSRTLVTPFLVKIRPSVPQPFGAHKKTGGQLLLFYSPFFRLYHSHTRATSFSEKQFAV